MCRNNKSGSIFFSRSYILLNDINEYIFTQRIVKYMTKIFDSLKIRKTTLIKHKDNGFSLIELVVAMSVMITLSVGGMISYSNMTKSSKKEAVEDAVNNVYKTAFNYEYDDDVTTDANTARDDWVNSSKNADTMIITVVRPSETTLLKVTVTDKKDKTITMTKTGETITP